MSDDRSALLGHKNRATKAQLFRQDNPEKYWVDADPDERERYAAQALDGHAQERAKQAKRARITHDEESAKQIFMATKGRKDDLAAGAVALLAIVKTCKQGISQLRA